ncbi:MAG TPA: UxaA family hydrolase [Firmicutes bacterium]|nr:UxaA family hydrolase [Bacillota bacterium]
MRLDYFLGLAREQGRPGVRDLLLVVGTVSCVTHVVQEVAARAGGVSITHDYGCLEFPSSLEQTMRTLAAAAAHPNVGAVLVVGLGCEQIDARELARRVQGKPVQALIVQEEGGSGYAVAAGTRLALRLRQEMGQPRREPFPVSELAVGVVCGASDWTTAIASNPTLGVMADLIGEQGGTVAMTETSGIPGAERVLAARARDETVAADILALSAYHADQARRRYGCPIYEVNPSPGNKAGGISTMVEKGMGNIEKVGRGTIYGVVDWANYIPGPGVWIMKDSGIGPDVFSVSGLSAGGCQVVVFTTGRGSPLGGALVPVVKVTGNPDTARAFAQNIDFDAGTVVRGGESLAQAGRRLHRLVLEVASGRLTRAEELGHREFGIPRPEGE